MVTYAIFRDENDENVVTIVSMTKEVDELIEEENLDVLTAMMEIGSLIGARYIISDHSDEKIMSMFPHAKVIEYKKGDVIN